MLTAIAVKLILSIWMVLAVFKLKWFSLDRNSLMLTHYLGEIVFLVSFVSNNVAFLTEVGSVIDAVLNCLVATCTGFNLYL